jgi:hypothetical protein
MPTAPLGNVRLAGETLTGEESVPARPTAGRLFVEGVSLIWANTDEPRTTRKSKRTVPPENSFVPYFAGLELKRWK